VRAVVLEAFGPPDVLVPTEVPAPTVGAGQVLIDVELANVTFVETQLRAGHPPDPAMVSALPTIPGNGVGGVVAGVGDGTDRALLGARVVTSTGGSGAYAEQVAVDARSVLRVPDDLGMAEAVALLADGRTAARLVEAAGIVDGEAVLVEAAGGGVGTLLVQLAGQRGARVVGAAGGARKLALARELGADATVDYRDPEWPERVRAELSGGVDVAFDGVGGAIGRAAFALVRDGGRFVPFGMASGEFAQLRDGDATRRHVRVVHLGPPTPADVARVTRGVLDDAAAGRLRPVIGQRFPLADAAAAHAAIERRDTIGKTLLVVAAGAGVQSRHH
jgi:NADPH2:quinone reductase